MNKWILAMRPWSFPASAMPALIAVSYIYLLAQGDATIQINLLSAILAVVGAIVFQASGNLIADYFDYKYNVDREETFGSSRLLVDGIFTPKTILNFGLILLVIGSIIGGYLFLQSGIALLYIGLFGIIGTVFYYKFKYKALGDLLIFIIYGQMIAFGTAYAATSQLIWSILWVSAPAGLLIVSILHANNTRDMEYDSKAGIHTQAMKIGVDGSKIMYQTIVLMSYMLIVALALVGTISPINLIVFLSFPIAMKNVKQMNSVEHNTLEVIKDLDAKSAQLVLIFSMLQIIGNVIALFV